MTFAASSSLRSCVVRPRRPLRLSAHRHAVARRARAVRRAVKRALTARSIVSTPRAASSPDVRDPQLDGRLVGEDRAQRRAALQRRQAQGRALSGLPVTDLAHVVVRHRAARQDRRVRLFTRHADEARGARRGAQHVSLVGARRRAHAGRGDAAEVALKLERAPSTATLGTLTVAVAPSWSPPPVAGARARADGHARPRPPRRPTPRPTPERPACADRFAATPASSVDWFGCDLPGNGDLKSWTNYVQRPFPRAAGRGARPARSSRGARRRAASSRHGLRPPLPGRLEQVRRRTDRRRSSSRATITYTMPAHGIDESIGALRIEIAPGGQRAGLRRRPRASRATWAAACARPRRRPYTDQPVLTLDLTGIAP